MSCVEVIETATLPQGFDNKPEHKKRSNVVLPKELYEKDTALGVRVMVKTFSLVALGVLFTLYMPSYLALGGVLLTGCGMSMLYLVGSECRQYAYFQSKTANAIARELINLPLVEGWIGCAFFVALMFYLCYYFGVCFVFVLFLFDCFVLFCYFFLRFLLLPSL